ncbi:MAG TPA: tRNA uridine-5-carboxymethylaminomethyl(34) synthesis GTPase MnmE [Bacteroidales bacterium]|nr:tRNA uridine-5-carboxymethylaminomethyl(34) synthesis GTPase MnmE [Bacteroidales bacterium]HSA44422.1 tRNA uridine-5-carboxymethylaminomethyl(34) synthesis GTPase MnmE [Bacteroidales bacterium]
MKGLQNIVRDDVICALATSPGVGAVALIRVSGNGCLQLLDGIFRASGKGKRLQEQPGYTILHGWIMDGDSPLDEVLVSVFRSPHSYTGEEMAEIGIHGSLFIQEKVLALLVSRSCRMAGPGEFTLRAFLNGKLDLSQAEAVADLIASNSVTSHGLALNQMRGNFSLKIKALRQQLIDLAALLELELDFSEEEVEFADRDQFMEILSQLEKEIRELLRSFSTGNVMKHGIPVAITGKPNVGKSTLLNAILNEDRALVSEVPGTTRDTIEDIINLGGNVFRFIDTAGLRHTTDHVENMGIERSREKIAQAHIVLYVFDITAIEPADLQEALHEVGSWAEERELLIIPVANKTDLLVESPAHFAKLVEMGTIFVSAKRKENINLILETLQRSAMKPGGSDQVILSSNRHMEALDLALQSLLAVRDGFRNQQLPDLIAADLRLALHHLGTITGEIVPDDILGSVFSRFCIGK